MMRVTSIEFRSVVMTFITDVLVILTVLALGLWVILHAGPE
jgi:hypothetical protein